MALTDCSVPSVDSFPTSVMTSIDGAVTMYPWAIPFRTARRIILFHSTSKRR